VVEVSIKLPLEIVREEQLKHPYCYEWFISTYIFGEKYACSVFAESEAQAIQEAAYKFQKAIDLGANYGRPPNRTLYRTGSMAQPVRKHN